MLVRATVIEDITQIDRIRQASLPWHTATLETQRTWFRTTPQASRSLRLCAEIDGQIVGSAGAGLDVTAADPGVATAVVNTHPKFRRQGIATTLYERIEDHLRAIGAKRLQVRALDEPDAIAFAVHRGFDLGATEQCLTVDPRALPPMPEFPADVKVASGAEAGPETLYQVDNLASRDTPGDVAYAGMSYQDWLERCWSTINHDVSMVAFVDATPAAVTLLDANILSGRAMSNGSSTLREYRGRGLVKLLKSVSLRKAATLGITAAFTTNDDTNAPMLAINSWLGYRFVAASRSVLKIL